MSTSPFGKPEAKSFSCAASSLARADKSYGIEVARLAGLPASVIARAREVLAEHEKSEHQLTQELSPGAAAPVQPVMFTPVNQEVLDALRTADLDNLKPLEALNLLAALKKQLS